MAKYDGVFHWFVERPGLHTCSLYCHDDFHATRMLIHRDTNIDTLRRLFYNECDYEAESFRRAEVSAREWVGLLKDRFPAFPDRYYAYLVVGRPRPKETSSATI